MLCRWPGRYCNFYPRSPCGERQNGKAPASTALDFYPRSPCGERRAQRLQKWPGTLFLSTLSLRRATAEIGPNLVNGIHFYPRSPCGERPHKHGQLQQGHVISIHALLAESDGNDLGGGRIGQGFLSTLSLRRATVTTLGEGGSDRDFYPRSPCGERRSVRPEIRQPCAISIHALLAESDALFSKILYLDKNFYPRSPCGERLFGVTV